MNITLRTVLVAGILAALSTTAFASAKIEGERDIARYQNAAGQAVEQIPFRTLVDWQALDDHSLAVWTASNKPWLVSVATPCDASIMSTNDVEFTSQQGTLKAGTDYVKVGNKECRVATIRPVDYKEVAELSRQHMTHAHHRMKSAGDTKSGG